jgi:hypothetical protein
MARANGAVDLKETLILAIPAFISARFEKPGPRDAPVSTTYVAEVKMAAPPCPAGNAD